MQAVRALVFSVFLALVLPVLANAAEQPALVPPTTSIEFRYFYVYPYAPGVAASDAASGMTFKPGDVLGVSVQITNVKPGYAFGLYLENAQNSLQTVCMSKVYGARDDYPADAALPLPPYQPTRHSIFTCRLPYDIAPGTYYVYGDLRESSTSDAPQVVSNGKTVSRYWSQVRSGAVTGKLSFKVAAEGAPAPVVAPPVVPVAPVSGLPYLQDIKVDTSGHKTYSEYKDATAAEFEIGKDSIYVAVKLRGARKGEKVTAYLVNNKFGKLPLCSSKAFIKDEPGFSSVLLDPCPVLTTLWHPGDYAVWVEHQDASGKVVQRGGMPARYWGKGNPRYFVRLTSLTLPAPTLDDTLATPEAVEVKGFYFVIDANIKQTNGATKETREDRVNQKFMYVPNGYVVIDSKVPYDSDLESVVTSIFATMYQKGAIGRWASDKEGITNSKGLEPVASQAECEKNPVNVFSTEIGDTRLEIRYCKVVRTNDDTFGLLLKISLAAGAGTPVKTPATPQLVKEEVNLNFDSKHLEGTVKLTIKEPVFRTIVLSPLFKECLDAPQNFKQKLVAKGGPAEYTLNVKYDPLCQKCGDSIPAYEYAVNPDEKKTVNAKVSCKAENVVIANGKLMDSDFVKLRTTPASDNSLNKLLAEYVSSHPLTTRFVNVDNADARKSYSLDGIGALKETDYKNTVYRVVKAAGARQLVVLGGPGGLPIASMDVAGKKVETDDAYAPEGIPVGRLQSFKGGETESAAAVTSLMAVIRQTVDSFKQRTGGQYLFGSSLKESDTFTHVCTDPECGAITTKPLHGTKEKMDAFSDGFSGADCDGSAYCRFAQKGFCIKDGNGACPQKGPYLQYLKKANFIAFIPDVSTSVSALARDTLKTEYVMLSKAGAGDHPMAARPVVFFGESDYSTHSHAYTVGAGASALVSLRTASYSPYGPKAAEAYKEIGTAFAPSDKPKTVGDALVASKESLRALYKNGIAEDQSIAYLLSLSGDPSVPLPLKEKPKKVSANPWGDTYSVTFDVHYFDRTTGQRVAGENDLSSGELKKLDTPYSALPTARKFDKNIEARVVKITLEVTAADGATAKKMIVDSRGFDFMRVIDCKSSPTWLAVGIPGSAKYVEIRYCGADSESAQNMHEIRWVATGKDMSGYDKLKLKWGFMTLPAIRPAATQPKDGWGTKAVVTFKANYYDVTTGAVDGDEEQMVTLYALTGSQPALLPNEVSFKTAIESTKTALPAMISLTLYGGDAEICTASLITMYPSKNWGAGSAANCQDSKALVYCAGADMTKAVSVKFCGGYLDTADGLSTYHIKYKAFTEARAPSGKYSNSVEPAYVESCVGKGAACNTK
ncbi:MAG: hypothetical protein V1787_01930 [Candidatus Micrarchaeota archaeon]